MYKCSIYVVGNKIKWPTFYVPPCIIHMDMFCWSVERIPPSRPNVTRTSDTSVLVEWSILTSSNSLPVVLFKVQYQQLKPRKRWKTADDEIPATILQFHVHDLKPGSSTCGPVMWRCGHVHIHPQAWRQFHNYRRTESWTRSYVLHDIHVYCM